MARVTGIDQQRIKALKRKLDFYYWKGQLVCRKWPDWSKVKMNPRQLAAQAALRECRKQQALLSPSLRATYRNMCLGRKCAYMDVTTKQFMEGWKATGQYPSVLYDFQTKIQGDNLIVTGTFSHLSPIPNLAIITEPSFYLKVQEEKKGVTMLCPAPPEPIEIMKDDEGYLDWTGLQVVWDEMEVPIGYMERPGACMASWGDGDPGEVMGVVWSRFWGDFWKANSDGLQPSILAGLWSYDNKRHWQGYVSGQSGRWFVPWVPYLGPGHNQRPTAISFDVNCEVSDFLRPAYGIFPDLGVSVELTPPVTHVVGSVPSSWTPDEGGWFDCDLEWGRTWIPPEDLIWTTIHYDFPYSVIFSLTPSPPQVTWTVPLNRIPPKTPTTTPFWYIFYKPFDWKSTPVSLPIPVW